MSSVLSYDNEVPHFVSNELILHVLREKTGRHCVLILGFFDETDRLSMDALICNDAEPAKSWASTVLTQTKSYHFKKEQDDSKNLENWNIPVCQYDISYPQNPSQHCSQGSSLVRINLRASSSAEKLEEQLFVR